MDFSAQDILMNELFEQEEEQQKEQNETLEILEFMKHNGSSITSDQLKAMLILNEFDLKDLASLPVKAKPLVTPVKKYFDLIGKLTLADRIKGNAKLSSILKANANPANQQPINPKDYQAKAMRESELR